MGYQGDQRPAAASGGQRQGRSWLLWLGLGAAAIIVVAGCLLGAYYLFQKFQSRESLPPPPLVVPTSPVTAQTSSAATVTPLAAAATPTLAADTPPTATSSASLPPSAGANNVLAVRVSPAPAIDGRLDGWESVAVIDSPYLVYRADSWDGSEDVSVLWRLAWDDSNLYVAAEVIDDRHVQAYAGNQIFRGDSLELQFDTDRDGDYDTAVSPDDFQIILSPGDFSDAPPSAFRFQGTDQGLIRDAIGPHHITLAAAMTSIGYTLEAAIPWADLNLQPAPGLVLGAAFNVNDNDTPGSAGQETMKSNVPGRRLADPTSWGTLQLR